MAMSSDSRIYKRLREQQRLIELQQAEIDQIRFEKEVLQDETRRLRMMTGRDQAAAYAKRLEGHGHEAPGLPFPSLHEHARSQRQGTHEAAVTAAVVACKTERSSTLFHTSGAETAPTGSTGLSFFCCAWIGV